MKIRALLFIAFFLMLPCGTVAFAACTDPDRPESTVVYVGDGKYYQYCDGTDWIRMHWPGGGSGGCTDPDRAESVIVYNGDARTLQACAGNQWMAMGPIGGTGIIGPTGCDAVGDECDDGSYYIGDVGSRKIYAASSASELNRSWNNGAFNPPWTTTGFTSTTDGPGNTAGLVALIDAGSPYEAAEHCNDLSAHTHDDWYLPARDELNLFWNGGSPLAGVVTDGSWYRASTEVTASNSYIQRFNDGSQQTTSKNLNLVTRCVRSPSAVCFNPDRPAGTMYYNYDYRVMTYCDGANWVPIGKATTALRDDTPDAFGFTDQSNVALSTLIESNIVQIAGLDVDAAVSISGDGSPEYRICGDATCTGVDHDWSSTAGTIDNGQYLQIRLSSNAANNTMNSATVTIGAASDQWDVTTAPAVFQAEHGNCAANDGGPFTQAGSISVTNADDVWSDGEYVFISDDSSGIRAFSFDGSSFTQVDSIATTRAEKLWGDDNYIYLADDTAGIKVFSFDGTDLTLLDAADTPGSAENVWGDGNYIYLADSGTGVIAYTFDGSDLSEVATYDTGNARSVWGDGSYIYVGGTDFVLKALTFDGASFSEAGTLSTGNFVNGIWGDDTYIYVSNNGSLGAYTFNGSSFSLIDSHNAGFSSEEVWFDGVHIFAVFSAGHVRALTFNGSNFSLVDDVGTSFIDSDGVWGDGTYIYVADAQTLYAYSGFECTSY